MAGEERQPLVGRAAQDLAPRCGRSGRAACRSRTATTGGGKRRPGGPRRPTRSSAGRRRTRAKTPCGPACGRTPRRRGDRAPARRRRRRSEVGRGPGPACPTPSGHRRRPARCPSACSPPGTPARTRGSAPRRWGTSARRRPRRRRRGRRGSATPRRGRRSPGSIPSSPIVGTSWPWPVPGVDQRPDAAGVDHQRAHVGRDRGRRQPVLVQERDHARLIDVGADGLEREVEAGVADDRHGGVADGERVGGDHVVVAAGRPGAGGRREDGAEAEGAQALEGGTAGERGHARGRSVPDPRSDNHRRSPARRARQPLAARTYYSSAAYLCTRFSMDSSASRWRRPSSRAASRAS